jgi:hypothetical protein
MVAMQPGVPGGIMVGTYQETATVSAVDKEKRKVTLATADGEKTTLTAGPDMVNFDQLQVGDQVKATVTQQLAVFVRKTEESVGVGGATTVALAAQGAKPGVMVADAVEVNAKVTAIDLKTRKATLQFPDGKSKTFKVRPDVDLTQASVGQTVLIRATQGVAITVEKP